MSKCGKGCMPECEYFTTGGCISPFNCSYKIEEISPKSATSLSNAFVQDLIAENAVLRERLEKAVELKYDIGDTVYLIQRTPDYPNGTILETTIRDIEMRKNKNGIYISYIAEYDNTYYCIDAEIDIFAFTNKSKAEARFAELKGGNNDDV